MYKLFKDLMGINNVGVVKDGTMSIPFNSDSNEYQAYLKWVDEGGIPEPADE